VKDEAMRQDRLPPGQTRTSGFPTLHTGPIPNFSPATWDFQVWGEVEESVVWTWDQFQALPRVAIQLDLHCVTKWSKLDTAWEGISLRTLIDGGWVRLRPTARFVMQHTDYGYTTNLPLEVALQENFILATHFDAQPLTPAHGFPVRGVVGSIPGRDDLKDVYLWKSAKWLRGLEFLRADMLGFWEANGYHNEGDVWKEQRRADNP
jgi:DMSO/TMAO reductase YedYZ molybdopterin-dependent catalytic subunit